MLVSHGQGGWKGGLNEGKGEGKMKAGRVIGDLNNQEHY